MEQTIVCTNRLQPLHKGHIQFWAEIRKRYPNNHLVVCVLRRSRHLDSLITNISGTDTFETLSRTAFVLDRNPLPNWERLRLATIAVHSEPSLTGNTTVLLRTRPDVAWDASIEDLPRNRLWAFNITAEPAFNRAKVDFYTAKGESVIEIEFGRHGGYTGDKIREALRNGSQDLSFLPNACRDYFRRECIQYFYPQP